MSVLRYRPWPRAAFASEFGPLFNRAAAANAEAGQWSPKVDIREDAGRFVLLADLPGVDPAAIELQMDRNVLCIKGERAQPALAEGERQVLGERRSGAFERRFALPETADADAITAQNRHGVLEIRIPKKARPAPRRIEVGAGSPQ